MFKIEAMRQLLLPQSFVGFFLFSFFKISESDENIQTLVPVEAWKKIFASNVAVFRVELYDGCSPFVVYVTFDQCDDAVASLFRLV